MRQKWLALVFFLVCLAGCGTTHHVSGTVTDTSSYTSVVSSAKGFTSIIVHHTIVVNGKSYGGAPGDVAVGDQVSFDDNSIWGMSNFQDATHHPDDWSWLWFVPIIAILAIIIMALDWSKRKTA